MALVQAQGLSSKDTRKAFNAFLAAVHRNGLSEIAATREVLHEAFGAALEVLKKDGLTADAFSRFNYSPADKYIAEFDDALMRAEKYKLVQFPNPSYTRMRIAMTPWTADEFLEEAGGARATLDMAAERFRERYLQIVW